MECPRHCIWVGDLDTYMNEAFIRRAFATMGEVVLGIRIICKRAPGYCFVDVLDNATVERCLNRLNGEYMPGSNPPRKFKIKTAMACEKIGKGLTIAETMSQFLEYYNQYTNLFSQMLNQSSGMFGCEIPGQPGADGAVVPGSPQLNVSQMRHVLEAQKAAALRNAATARYAASVLNATLQISGVNQFPVEQSSFPPVPPDFTVEQNSFNSQWTGQFPPSTYSCSFPPFPPTEAPPALPFGPPVLPPPTAPHMPPMLPPPPILNPAAMQQVAEAQKAAAVQAVQNIIENKHFNSEQNLWLNPPFSGFSSDYSSYAATECIPAVSVPSTLSATSAVPSTPAVISAPPMLNAAAVQFISESRKASGVQKPIESKHTYVRNSKKRQNYSSDKRSVSSTLTEEKKDHTLLKRNSYSVLKVVQISPTSPEEHNSVSPATSTENQISLEESAVKIEAGDDCMEISEEESLEEKAETTEAPEYIEKAETTEAPEYIDPDPPIDIVAMNTDFMGRSEEIYDVLMNCHWQPLDTAVSGIPATVDLR